MVTARRFVALLNSRTASFETTEQQFDPNAGFSAEIGDLSFELLRGVGMFL